jgi:hypothetical protein
MTLENRECSECIHKNVCSLRKEYNDVIKQINSDKSLIIYSDFIGIDIKCKEYIKKER